jgi:Tfp pilus assembly protein PilF
MKKILFVLLLFITTTIAAQQPSKKDMDKAMAAYSKMMNDPQLKKTLDSMGVKMGSSQTVRKQLEYAAKNTSAQQMNMIMGEETIPSKDMARINALSKTVLPDAEFSVLLKRIQAATSVKISAPSKKIADQLFQALKKQNGGTAELAAMASGLWMKGYAELGLELMGRAVAEDVKDADNLNNYAAFLSTMGGEQLALPILQKLNSRYPDNSTILNNIGQAWFGLGDINTSKKYLDSAIHFFGMHSQANYTKAVIEESKGNKQGAIDAMKISLQNGYSPAKAKRLEKLQGGVNNGDIGWNFPKPSDALGLEKLRTQRPEFYFSVADALNLHPKWVAFWTACLEKSQAIKEEANKRMATVQNEMMNAIKTNGASNSKIYANAVNNFIARKAREMLYAVDREEAGFTQRIEARAKKMCESFPARRSELSAKLTAISEKNMKAYYKQQEDDGSKFDKFEGDNSHPEKLLREAQDKICQESKPLVNEYYLYCNRILSDLSNEWVNKELYYTNEIVYYNKYANLVDNEYQVAKLMAISHFLSVIGDNKYTQPVDFFDDGFWASGLTCKDKDKGPQSMKLADYDELHCDNHITLYVPKVGVSHWDCNIETDTLNFGVEGFGLDGNYKENLANGKKSWHVELGYSESVGSKTAGPVKAGGSVSGGAFVEGDETGTTDVGVIVKGTVKVGSTVSVPGVTTGTSIGIEGRVGFNSGPSLSGKGGLSGISIK